MSELPRAHVKTWRKPPPVRRRTPLLRARSLVILLFVIALDRQEL